MNLSRVYTIFIRQIFLLRHSGTRFLNLFLWAGIDVILWGFIATYFDKVERQGLGIASLLLGGLILWNFLVQAQQGVMRAFFEDMWTRNFVNLFASPLTLGEYTLGLVLTSIVTSAVGLAFMTLLAGIGFGFTFFKLGIFFFPFLLVLFLFGIALGIFTIGIVMRLGQEAEWIAWPLPFVFTPFVGVFYPISVLPIPLQIVAKLLSPSYVFEGMRSILLLGQFSWFNLGMGFATALAYVALAYWFFASVYYYAVSNGLLVRFNVEDT